MKTKATIITIEEIPTHGKVLLREMKDQSKSLITRASNGDGFNRQTLLYEKDKFVIIEPNGEPEKALLYGDWDAALYASKQILLGDTGDRLKLTISIEPVSN